MDKLTDFTFSDCMEMQVLKFADKMTVADFVICRQQEMIIDSIGQFVLWHDRCPEKISVDFCGDEASFSFKNEDIPHGIIGIFNTVGFMLHFYSKDAMIRIIFKNPYEISEGYLC